MVSRVLIACECSGMVRDAFSAAGYYAVSCDFKPTRTPGPHYQGSVLDLLQQDWDLLIAHPPCTYLSSSGLHWNYAGRGWDNTRKALSFVQLLMDAPIPRIAIENPKGIISTQIRKPDQSIQPYQFGHDASKQTDLWLKNLPPLEHTDYYPPRMVNGLPRWGNQTDSGQNKLSPGATRAERRSNTYENIAKAMAQQWGPLLGATNPFYGISDQH